MRKPRNPRSECPCFRWMPLPTQISDVKIHAGSPKFRDPELRVILGVRMIWPKL